MGIISGSSELSSLNVLCVWGQKGLFHGLFCNNKATHEATIE